MLRFSFSFPLAFALLLQILVLSVAEGQIGNGLLPCGTLPERSEWLRRFQAQPELFPRGGGQLTHVPLKLHVVGSNTGTGYINIADMLDAICVVNQDYQPVNFHYFIDGDLNFIDSSIWANHAEVTDGAAMMFANNFDSVVNVYMCASAAGNAGYNLPYAGICMANGYMTGARHTFAHELGHHFALPHPFLGWEGKVYNYADTTPFTVVYDYTYFQDTLILDTLILDTTEVEYVDGHNCLTAADGFCDTPPDYLSYRWTCNAAFESPELQRDPDNVDFHSDGSLFMSYSNDECRSGTGFTPLQMAAMQANINTERSYLLGNNNIDTTALTATAVGIEPVTAAINDGALEFRWSAVPGATHYLVQLCLTPTCNQITWQIVTSDTFYTSYRAYAPRPANAPLYAWKVRAFKAGNTCSDFGPLATFNTSNVVALNEVSEQDGSIRSVNPLLSGESLTLFFDRSVTTPYTVSLLNMLGQTLWSQTLVLEAGQSTATLTPPAVPVGLYVLVVENAGQRFAKQLLIE